MARLKGAKRQNNQLQLAFEEATHQEQVAQDLILNDKVDLVVTSSTPTSATGSVV